MLDIDNSDLKLSEVDTGPASKVFRAELVVHAERRMENVFTNSSEGMDLFKVQLKRDVQQIIYGDLIDLISEAYKIALSHAGTSGLDPDLLENKFQQIFRRLKVAVPFETGP